MTTFWAVLSALPKLLALIQFIAGMVRDAEQRGLGRQDAIAEALEIAHRDLAAADAAANEARGRHAATPSDDAFDRTFQRTGD